MIKAMIYTLYICMCQIGVNTFMQKYVCAVHETVRVRNDMRWLYKVIIAEAETGGWGGTTCQQSSGVQQGIYSLQSEDWIESIYLDFFSLRSPSYLAFSLQPSD